MGFLQTPPALDNTYDADPLLQSWLEVRLPPDVRAAIEPELRHLGELAGNELYRLQLADRKNEPVLTSWDPWGNRIDHIELTEVWRRAKGLTAEHGFVWAGYDRRLGAHARTHQFLMNHVVQPSLDLWSCPLAMTDGAAKSLVDLANPALAERALPRLLARDPAAAWTSGQWMTERTGGSDVSRTETVARPTADGFRLYGTKWFTSATTSEMALTLARPEGQGEGSRQLALFYVETKDEDGRPNGIVIHRLKDKLGTRKVPTAELELVGARATPVKGLTDGVKNITTMLTMTRIWNSVGAVSGMRRALQLVQDYAKRRVAFGARLADKPLHVDTVAGLAAELYGAFALTFRAVELLGQVEHGVGGDDARELLRALTPLVKLTTGRQAVAVASEALEAFGGAGYVEDTGLPRLLADAQVLSIWEGTTNVLSLDLLRAFAKPGPAEALRGALARVEERVSEPSLGSAVTRAARIVDHAFEWLRDVRNDGPRAEAGARQFALALGRAMEVAFLAEHAEALAGRRHQRPTIAAVERLARGLQAVVEVPGDESRLLFDALSDS